MRVLATLALCGLAATGCRERERVPVKQIPEHLRPITFKPDRELQFVYADLKGAFKTTTRALSVPIASRRAVRVIDPSVPIAERDPQAVHLVDLTDPNDDGTYTTRATTLLDFENRALAALPPGEASRVPIPRLEGNVGAPVPSDQIVLYGTRWCGACKQARALLRKRKTPFVDKDIERDPEAAATLAAKAATAGIRADRVPIIDVRGRLLVGFDRDRLRTLLGEAI